MMNTPTLTTAADSTWAKIEAAIDADQAPPFAVSSDALWFSSRPEHWNDRPWIVAVLALACGFALTLLTLRVAVERQAVDPHNRIVTDRLAPKPRVEIGRLPKTELDSEPQLVSFRKPDQPQQVAGRMVFDLEAMQIHVSIEMLDDRHYAFWFVTQSGKWIPAGMLNRFGKNHYGNIVDVPKTDSPIAYTAISVEASDGVTSPGLDIALVSDAFQPATEKSL